MNNIVFYILSFLTLSLSSNGQDREVYFSGGMGYSDLFKVNADGKDVTRLTNLESRGEYQPQVSPNGKYIIFNTYRYGGWKLAIAELSNGVLKKGSVRKLLVNSKGYEYDADWSADGKRIVFVGFTNGRSGYRQLFITDLSGMQTIQLTDDARNNYAPHFSTDGNHIYFQSEINGIYAIQKINIATKEINTVALFEDAHAIAPSLAPNGKLIAFHKVHEDESVTVHILNLESKVEKMIYGQVESEKNYLNRQFETPLFSYAIGWSGNSQEIVFAKHIGDSIFELFIGCITTGKVRQLTQLKESSSQPSWY